MIGFRALAFFLASLCPLGGCSDEPVPAVPTPNKAQQLNEHINQSLSDVLTKATDTFNSLSPKAEQLSDAALNEVKKLSVIEYKVVDLPIEAPSEALEATLAKLGSERWECFAAVPGDTGTRLICHRRPETYLQYVPRWVP